MNRYLDNIRETAIVLFAIALLFVILIAFIKSETFRWILGGLLAFVFTCTAIYSGIHINRYYTAEGGIYGKIQSIFDRNVVNLDEDENKVLTFDFADIMLVQHLENDYRAEFTTEDSIQLDSKENYVVYCNDMPCEIIEFSDDYVIAEYHYLFYDEFKNEMLADTLYFRFAFYGQSTRLIVNTNGGQDAVSLWNSYFQKNDFIVKIDSTKESYVNESELITLNFKMNDEIIKKVFIRKGSDFTLPSVKLNEYATIDSWFLNDELVFEITNIQEEMTFVANCYSVSYYSRTDISDLNSAFYKVDYYKKDSLIVMPEDPERVGYTFLGWSLDKENVYDFSSYVVTENIEIYALWELNLEIQVSLNGGSLTYNGTNYTEDFSFYVNDDKPIVFENVSKTGYEFLNFKATNRDFTTEDITLNALPQDIYDCHFTFIHVNGYEIPEDYFSTLKIEINWLEVSEDSLKRYAVAEQLGLTDYVTGEDACDTNEEFIKYVYYYITGEMPSESLTEYEVCYVILDSLEIDCPEDVTYDTCLDLLSEKLGV